MKSSEIADLSRSHLSCSFRMLWAAVWNVASKTYRIPRLSDSKTAWSTFRYLDAIPECDRRTDGRTDSFAVA